MIYQTHYCQDLILSLNRLDSHRCHPFWMMMMMMKNLVALPLKVLWQMAIWIPFVQAELMKTSIVRLLIQLVG